MPRSADMRIMSSRLPDHIPWKMRSLALKPNQFAPVSQTGLPLASTIMLPTVCSQSSPGSAVLPELLLDEELELELLDEELELEDEELLELEEDELELELLLELEDELLDDELELLDDDELLPTTP